MPSADELRKQIEENRAALREALQAAGSKWEDGTDDNWGAKRIAQHVIGAEVNYANLVSTAMEGRPQELKDAELASADAALAKEEEAAAMAEKAYRYVEERDLKKRADVPGSYSQDIEGAMLAAAAHIAEHAQQLKSL